MPSNQTLGVRDTRQLDTAIREIDVTTGLLVLTTPEGKIITLEAGNEDSHLRATESFDPPLAGMLAYAPEGAGFHVTYETDPVGHEGSRRLTPKRKRAPRRKRSATKGTRASARKSKSKAKTRKKG